MDNVKLGLEITAGNTVEEIKKVADKVDTVVTKVNSLENLLNKLDKLKINVNVGTSSIDKMMERLNAVESMTKQQMNIKVNVNITALDSLTTSITDLGNKITQINTTSLESTKKMVNEEVRAIQQASNEKIKIAQETKVKLDQIKLEARTEVDIQKALYGERQAYETHHAFMKQAKSNSDKFRIDSEQMVYKMNHDTRQKELEDMFKSVDAKKKADIEYLNTVKQTSSWMQSVRNESARIERDQSKSVADYLSNVRRESMRMEREYTQTLITEAEKRRNIISGMSQAQNYTFNSTASSRIITGMTASSNTQIAQRAEQARQEHLIAVEQQRLHEQWSGRNTMRGGNDQQVSQINSLNSALSTLNQTLMMVGVTLSGRQIMEYADQWLHFTNAVGIVTEKTGGATQMQEKLFTLAQNNRVPLESITSLYLRMSRAAESLNMTQGQTVQMIDTVTKSLAIMGTSPTAVRGGLLQLEQALGGVTVRGQEFKSILDSMPNVMKIVSDNYMAAAKAIKLENAVLNDATSAQLQAIESEKVRGMSISELRNKMYAGQISSEAFARAIIMGQKEIDETYKNTDKTFAQAFVEIENGFTKYIGKMNEATETSNSFFNIAVKISESFNEIGAGLLAAAGGLGAFTIAVNLNKAVLVGLFTLIAKHPIALLVSALVTAGIYLYEMSDKIKPFENSIVTLGEVFDTWKNNLVSNFKLVGEWWDWLQNKFALSGSMKIATPELPKGEFKNATDATGLKTQTELKVGNEQQFSKAISDAFTSSLNLNRTNKSFGNFGFTQPTISSTFEKVIPEQNKGFDFKSFEEQNLLEKKMQEARIAKQEREAQLAGVNDEILSKAIENNKKQIQLTKELEGYEVARKDLLQDQLNLWNKQNPKDQIADIIDYEKQLNGEIISQIDAKAKIMGIDKQRATDAQQSAQKAKTYLEGVPAKTLQFDDLIERLQESMNKESNVLKIKAKISPEVDKYSPLFEKYGKQFGVSPQLLASIAQQESRGNPSAYNKDSHAAGLMQFVPKTAKAYSVTNAFDPEQSVQAAAKMMADLLKQYQGDIAKALAGYNWGSGNIQKAGAAWKTNAPSETKNYMSDVMGRLGDEKSTELVAQKNQNVLDIVKKITEWKNLTSKGDTESAKQLEIQIESATRLDALNNKRLANEQQLAEQRRKAAKEFADVYLKEKAGSLDATKITENAIARMTSKSVMSDIIAGGTINNYEQIVAEIGKLAANKVGVSDELRKYEAEYTKLSQVQNEVGDGTDEQKAILNDILAIQAKINELKEKESTVNKEINSGVQAGSQILAQRISVLTKLNRENEDLKSSLFTSPIESEKQKLVRDAGGNIEQAIRDAVDLRENLKSLISVKDLVVNQFTSGFTGMFDDMLNRGKSFTEAFRSMFKNMISNISGSLMNMGMQAMLSGNFLAGGAMMLGGAGVGLLQSIFKDKVTDNSMPVTSEKGTVLGRLDDASNSVQNIVDTLWEINRKEFPMLEGMYKTFRDLNVRIADFSTAITKDLQTSLARGENFQAGLSLNSSQITKSKSPLYSNPVSGIGTSGLIGAATGAVTSGGIVGAGVGAMTGTSATAVSGFTGLAMGAGTGSLASMAGAAVLGLAGGLLVGGLIWGLGKLLGIGKITVTKVTEGVLINNMKLMADDFEKSFSPQAFAKYKIVQTGWFSDTTAYQEVLTPLNKEFASRLFKIYKSLGDSFKNIITTLNLQDVLGNVLEDYTTPYLKMDWLKVKKDKNGDVSKYIQDQLNAHMDRISEQIFGNLFGAFQKVGEGMLETVGRLSTQLGTVYGAFARIKVDMGNVDLGGVAFSDTLIQLYDSTGSANDGLKNFTSSMKDFYDVVTSAGDKVTSSYTNVQAVIDNFKAQMPESSFLNGVSAATITPSQLQQMSQEIAKALVPVQAEATNLLAMRQEVGQYTNPVAGQNLADYVKTLPKESQASWASKLGVTTSTISSASWDTVKPEWYDKLQAPATERQSIIAEYLNTIDKQVKEVISNGASFYGSKDTAQSTLDSYIEKNKDELTKLAAQTQSVIEVSSDMKALIEERNRIFTAESNILKINSTLEQQRQFNLSRDLGTYNVKTKAFEGGNFESNTNVRDTVGLSQTSLSQYDDFVKNADNYATTLGQSGVSYIKSLKDIDGNIKLTTMSFKMFEAAITDFTKSAEDHAKSLQNIAVMLTDGRLTTEAEKNRILNEAAISEMTKLHGANSQYVADLQNEQNSKTYTSYLQDRQTAINTLLTQSMNDAQKATFAYQQQLKSIDDKFNDGTEVGKQYADSLKALVMQVRASLDFTEISTYLTSFKQSIKDWVTGLRINSLGSTKSQLDAAQANFKQIQSQVLNPFLSAEEKRAAQGKVTSSADQYIGAIRNFYGSSKEANALIEKVISDVTALPEMIPVEVEQLNVLKQIAAGIDVLAGGNSMLTDVTKLIADLQPNLTDANAPYTQLNEASRYSAINALSTAGMGIYNAKYLGGDEQRAVLSSVSSAFELIKSTLGSEQQNKSSIFTAIEQSLKSVGTGIGTYSLDRTKESFDNLNTIVNSFGSTLSTFVSNMSDRLNGVAIVSTLNAFNEVINSASGDLQIMAIGAKSFNDAVIGWSDNIKQFPSLAYDATAALIIFNKSMITIAADVNNDLQAKLSAYLSMFDITTKMMVDVKNTTSPDIASDIINSAVAAYLSITSPINNLSISESANTANAELLKLSADLLIESIANVLENTTLSDDAKLAISNKIIDGANTIITMYQDLLIAAKDDKAIPDSIADLQSSAVGFISDITAKFVDMTSKAVVNITGFTSRVASYVEQLNAINLAVPVIVPPPVPVPPVVTPPPSTGTTGTGNSTIGYRDFAYGDSVLESEAVNSGYSGDYTDTSGMLSFLGLSSFQAFERKMDEKNGYTSNYQKFATGGAFTNGIVSRPTSFNMGLMGEAGSEAIMPLTNVNGKLGVVAANDSGNNEEELAEMRRQNQLLIAQNKLLQEAFATLITQNKTTNEKLDNIEYNARLQVNG